MYVYIIYIYAYIYIYIYKLGVKIRQYYVIQKPLTVLDFMIESRVFVMQDILIKENSQGT